MFPSHRTSLIVPTALLAFAFVGCTHAETRAPIPAPQVDASLSPTHSKQTAIFAGGCFWGTQSVFERVKGVVATTAGYAGGA